MKLILVGIALAIVIAAVSMYGGYSFAKADTLANDIKAQMHNEHFEIASRIDVLNCKIDNMDKKLDVLVNIATHASAFENDKRP